MIEANLEETPVQRIQAVYVDKKNGRFRYRTANHKKAQHLTKREIKKATGIDLSFDPNMCGDDIEEAYSRLLKMGATIWDDEATCQSKQ